MIKNLTANLYFYQDASASTSHLADSTGHLLEWYRYDLQGTPIFYNASNSQLPSSNYGIRHLFTGQQWYSEIGLYDLRNRFYSPDIGRFLQSDPIGFGGDATNLYRYCENNPTNTADPSGELAYFNFVGLNLQIAIPVGYSGASLGFAANFSSAMQNAYSGTAAVNLGSSRAPAIMQFTVTTQVYTPSGSQPSNYVWVGSQFQTVVQGNADQPTIVFATSGDAVQAGGALIGFPEDQVTSLGELVAWVLSTRAFNLPLFYQYIHTAEENYYQHLEGKNVTMGPWDAVPSGSTSAPEPYGSQFMSGLSGYSGGDDRASYEEDPYSGGTNIGDAPWGYNGGYYVDPGSVEAIQNGSLAWGMSMYPGSPGEGGAPPFHPPALR